MYLVATVIDGVRYELACTSGIVPELLGELVEPFSERGDRILYGCFLFPEPCLTICHGDCSFF
jgi:hypothetical protein